jgi:hypothetical protein
MRRASILVPLFTALAMLGCGRSRPIRIILPDQRPQSFSIVKDTKLGEPLQLRDGYYEFRIPDSGVLYIRDDSPFYEFHKETVLYRDGTVFDDSGRMYDTVSEAGMKHVGDTWVGSTDFEGTTHHWNLRESPRP